jgi:hypothetical protein
MMKQYKKKFSHVDNNALSFETTVTLYVKNEKHFGGVSLHRVDTVCFEADFSLTEFVDAKDDLILAVDRHRERAFKFAVKPQTEEELALLAAGFCAF